MISIVWLGNYAALVLLAIFLFALRKDTVSTMQDLGKIASGSVFAFIMTLILTPLVLPLTIPFNMAYFTARIIKWFENAALFKRVKEWLNRGS